VHIRKWSNNGVGKNVPSHNPPEIIPCLTQVVLNLIYIIFGLEALRLHSKKITPLCLIVVQQNLSFLHVCIVMFF
jgi:hypothetical protein